MLTNTVNQLRHRLPVKLNKLFLWHKLPAWGPLWTDRLQLYWLEVEVFEGEVSFHNASGLHTCAQHVLLSWDVVWLADPLQVIQVAERQKKSGV